MPLKQTEICWLLQQQPENSIVQQALYAVYAQQQISIEGRILLSDWITANAEVWYRLSSEILPSEATTFLMSAAEFLEQKLQNSDNEMYKDKRLINFHISYIRDVCSGKPVAPLNSNGQQILIQPSSYLLRLRHCLLEETCYFEKLLQQDDIDGAVCNLVSSSVMLGKNLDNFVKVLERIYGATSMNNGINAVQQQALWAERQAQQEAILLSIKNYIDGQKRAESALLNYRARFNRQMARESFAERPTLYLDQLQPAFDTAAQVAMRDLSRLQMTIIFARHIGDDEMALQLQSTANEVFTFLCSSLVSNCLVLERQMPQIVRKGAKFAITPQLRMLCPSVLCQPAPGSTGMTLQVGVNPSAIGGPRAAMEAASPMAAVASPPILGKVAGGFAISQQQHPLAIDTMVEQRVTAIQQQQQQQQVPSRMGSSSSRVSRGSTTAGGALMVANVDVDVYFLSETQAQEFVKNLVLPKQNSGALIHSAQLTLDRSSKQCGAVFKALSLSNFSRGDRKHSQLVTEEKFCLAFTCGIPLRALVQLIDAQQHTTVLASVLSLPIVVTVHNSQEANAAIATLWDNYFAELNRLPFEVPRKAVWADVKQLLNGRWKAICGQGLSEQNLAYLADRLLHSGNNSKRMSSMLGPMNSVSSSSGVNNSGASAMSNSYCYDNETVTWTMLAKDLLPCYNAELPRFTFWDWFHSCLKLMSKDCLYSFWPDHLVGFASHEQVEEMLKDCEPGTFLLRFSSTELGAVVIPYVKNHKNGVKFVERGYGPCTFKECEPCKVIADLKPLKSFYPSMRAKHDVLREIDELNNKNPGSRKKKNKSGHGGYEKLEQKTVGASSSSEDTEDDGGSGDNSNDESMNCDVISNTPPSVSPLAPLGMGAQNDDSVSSNVPGILSYRQPQFGMSDQPQSGFVAFPSAFSTSANSSASGNFFGMSQNNAFGSSSNQQAGNSGSSYNNNMPTNSFSGGVHESRLF